MSINGTKHGNGECFVIIIIMFSADFMVFGKIASLLVCLILSARFVFIKFISTVYFVGVLIQTMCCGV